MSSTSRHLRLGIALAAAATLLVPGVAGATTADGDGAASEAQAVETTEGAEHRHHPRLRRLCNRVPRVEERANRILERIKGDETVRGSLAWLDLKAQEARDNDRPQLATVLENRRNTRAKAVEVIELRLVEVETIHQICIDQGFGE
ncbi:MAG: hypothetical protein OEV40_26125 [Acidimicrobiia bacterium]|nr:hypothetical protein [Acidimicrobiia bacterium]